MMNASRDRKSVMLALLAMMLLVLSPTISKVFAHGQTNFDLVEICTSEGTQWVSVNASELDDQTTSVHDHDGDCSFCHLQLTHFIAPQLQPLITRTELFLFPFLYLQAPHTLFAWTKQPARAPPFSA